MPRGRSRWRTSRVGRGRVSIRALAVLLVAALAVASEPRAYGEQQVSAPSTGISASALAQIQALLKEKATRSATEQKLDSQLIYELRMRSGQAIAPGVDRIETDVPYAD